MPQFDRFLIAPSSTGLQTDTKAWLVNDDAWVELNNAYIFRGRLRKRFGSTWMGTSQLSSRLGVQAGTYGTPVSPVPGSIFEVGQAFSVGSDIFTVYQTGTPANMYSTNPNASGTFDTSNGNFTITYSSGAPLAGTPIYWYSSQPVMGLCNYEYGPINDQPSFAFDPQFAYVFSGGIWTQFGPSPGNQWHGTNINFFWTYNYQGLVVQENTLFVSNYYTVNAFDSTGSAASDADDDPIWVYYNNTWNIFSAIFNPLGTGTSNYQVVTARIIVAFKNRLVLLNTIEQSADGTTNYLFKSRARYSAFASPFATNAWYEANYVDGGGNAAIGAGYRDAPTQEAIISAEFIKDRLIVYFERSTWELAYTGNDALPFVWQKLNTELGSDATFSSVAFDKVILTIGNTGVHACNGSNVERIDSKIPDQIFNINDGNQDPLRVYGIRDFFTELVYWTYPSDTAPATSTFPDKVFVYNYRNNSWAFFDDCITVFGYFEQQTGTTWASTFPQTWEDANWAWGSGLDETQFRQIIAGNQQGYVFIVDPDESRNAGVMQITDLVDNNNGTVTITIINHNFTQNDYVAVENTGIPSIDGTIGQVNVFDAKTIQILGTLNGGVYAGGGTAARVSPINMMSKQFNPYIGQARNFYIQKIDFAVERTANGQITVDYSPSSAINFSIINTATATGAIIGTGILETTPYALYPLEQLQEILWHPLYFQTDGEFIQLNIYMQYLQMIDPAIAWSPFELHGLILFTQPTGARLQ